MIKFFRKIRLSLLSEGKTGKYLKYAIGEIVLVVIGILIALQINNWNEQTKLDAQEQAILKELYQDFSYNELQLDSLQKYIRRAHRGNKGLLEILKQQDVDNWDDYKLDSTTRDSLDHYLDLSGHFWTFNPKNGTVNAIINSSSLDLIKNDSLRRAIISWNDVVDDYLEDEHEYEKLNDDFLKWTRLKLALTRDFDHKQNLKIFYSEVYKNFVVDYKTTTEKILIALEEEGVIRLNETILSLSKMEIDHLN